jgi:hypothetical protein
MPVKIIEYKQFQLRALALQIPGLNRFMSSLLIIRNGPCADEGDCKLFPPRSDEKDGLFRSDTEALDAALRLGKNVVDGKAAGFTVEDL